MTGARKLNLGCGEFKKEGFVNVDAEPRTAPDVLHDLDAFPYPFADGSFDLVEADHVLEHLADPFAVMRELHRVLAPGGRLVVRVPHFSRGFTHAGHRRGFDVSFPYYFQPSFPGGYAGVEFLPEGTRLRWFAFPHLKKAVLPAPAFLLGRAFGAAADALAKLSPLVCSRFWCFAVGGFEEIEFRFKRGK